MAKLLQFNRPRIRNALFLKSVNERLMQAGFGQTGYQQSYISFEDWNHHYSVSTDAFLSNIEVRKFAGNICEVPGIRDNFYQFEDFICFLDAGIGKW